MFFTLACMPYARSERAHVSERAGLSFYYYLVRVHVAQPAPSRVYLFQFLYFYDICMTFFYSLSIQPKHVGPSSILLHEDEDQNKENNTTNSKIPVLTKSQSQFHVPVPSKVCLVSHTSHCSKHPFFVQKLNLMKKLSQQ